MTNFETGLDVCLRDPPASLARGMRFALLANQASLDAQWRYAWDGLAERFPGQLVSICSPQHGLWSEQQANMIESPHEVHPRLQVPIHSLYSETRRPTAAMLADVDGLVIDLQDVGTRVYTFIWTMLECLHVCAERQVPVMVLDRPNPLGGEAIEGPRLETEYRSFVGNADWPMRHGLTMGEAARLLVRDFGLNVELTVVPLRGWNRGTLWPQLGRQWIAPSPNLPKWESVLCYPGQVLLEGTNLSEGRGTTTPFELFGAPFLDAAHLADQLTQFQLPAVTARPMRFVPTFDKWRGQRCDGVYLHVQNARTFASYRTTVALLAAARRQSAEQTCWLPPPYEYDEVHMPLDILSGSARLRERLEGESFTRRDLDELTQVDAAAWHEQIATIKLY